MWKVKNIGTCTWTKAFSLVLVAAYKDGGLTGETFGNPPVIIPAFTEEVTYPNRYTWISINMKTPSETGLYRLDYKFQTPDGEIFGVWDFGSEGTLWIIINITK